MKYPNVAPPAVPLRADRLPAPAAAFLPEAVALGLLDAAGREAFLAERADRLREYTTAERVGLALVQSGLLTGYQVERILNRATHGLVLGNYRVLEELGQGGMGTVYLAEHRLMRRRVAVKVVPIDEDCHPVVRQRFYAEMRVLAELSHANVVLALDAGELTGPPPPALTYLVMELVDGADLEKHVLRNGVLGVAAACEYARQAAAGLQAAHDRHLVHRDLKPSNLLLSRAGQVKLVDFGLARQFASRLTDQRALLGSVEFMAPEQSFDPSAVGKEADIYGLAATLFWLLSGEGPYPHVPHIGQALRQLQQQPPRRLHCLRDDVPPGLDDLVARMLERDPARRPRSALEVAEALRPFAGALPPADQLSAANRQLEQALRARTNDLRNAHDALLFALAALAESRDGETPGHLRRMQQYTRALALEVARTPPWQGLVDARFLEQLERCVPLHDIGKIGLPDEILLKPASLTARERATAETHVLVGDRLLEGLGRQYGAALDFLGMARDIVRHHHERCDGTGYPDGLRGDAIPPAARLVAVADVYDALRRMRIYKPAMSHTAAVCVLRDRSPGQFDPILLDAFGRCHGQFERIFDTVVD